MYHCGMRQVGERHVAYKVDLMVWSNRLDLLALSNFKGEVQIHRLHWQKVWNFPPPKEHVTVRGMAWRPDGKALAIGYSSGAVYIVDIEDKEILDKYELEQEPEEFEISKHYGITCVTWAVRAEMLESVLEPSIYDDSSTFLQNLPATGEYKNQGTDENNKDLKELKVPNQLHMLMVGYGSGFIYMNIFGRYPYGTIHLAEVIKDDLGEYNILDICMSDDFSFMQVLYTDRITNNLHLSLINTSVLSAFAEEMFIVARKHNEIARLTSYLDKTMISITEAWEHILLEMDTKMADFAASVPVGGVSADLLELLMLGTPSDELELCLLQKLTVNDLKKLSNSIELSYSTIQKLVLKQLNIVGQSLTYYLSELRGLTRIPDRYKVMGIEENTVTAAIRACCAFLNKCLELQQVIDTSMRNYKAFFRWLFVVIVRLVGEQTPTEIVKITQQELGHIAEFLYNFDNAQVHHSPQYHGESLPDKPVKFNLERLGQYLEDQELTILPDNEDNPWHKFLKDNACLLKDNDTIFSLAEFKKFSLVQQQNHLKSAISQVFDVSKKETGKYFSAIFNIKCYEDRSNGKLSESLRICQAYFESENSFMMAFIDSMHINDGIHYMSIKMKEKAWSITAMKYAFSSIILGDKEPNDENLSILDLQFYSFEYLSVVAQHPRIEENSIFIQVPVAIFQINALEYALKPKLFLFNEKVIKKNIAPLIEPGVFKVLDKMDGFRVAVSGGRKVAVVLSKSHRKVRVFEMEIDGDDEEDETLDTTTQSQSEVQIHRLHWQKVWNFPPPKEHVTVRGMAWRPDGKALAIGYSSGAVYIVDIEDKEILDKYELEQEPEEFEISKHYGITCVTWAVRAEMLESVLEPSIYDDSSTFLQNLPATGEYKNQGTDENNKDLKELKVPNQLHMLMVGYGSGFIYMNIFGRYPYGTIHLAEVIKDDLGEYNILDICMSDDFSFMQVLYTDRITNNLHLSLINTSVLSAFAEEMFIVARKHNEIARLTSYLDKTMISITEAWEHILLEMDTKMADFAASVPVGGVSADLLELLMLGTPSDELELCLLQKLTVNDLKKLSNSIELSYSTIQKLVLKQLNIVGQSLTYYLSELRGLTRIPDRYKVMGIEENTVTAAIRACCAFLNKCLELQQVIDTSMRNYKAFFRWLFVVIVRLVGEQTPTEIVKITQQELGHIAEFLYNFDNAQVHHSPQYHGESLPDKPVKFNLERLGQYLEDQELTILPDNEDNPWHTFLKDNACLLKDNDTIFSLAEFKKFSFVQQQNHLKSAISQVFDVSKKETGKYFSAIFNIKCYEDRSNGKLSESLRICQAYFESENSFMMAFIDSMHINDGIHYMSIKMKEKAWSITAMKYAFSSIILGDKEPNDENLSILDLQFYSFEYLSVVAQHPRIEENSIFIQVPVAIFQINALEYALKPKLFLFNEKVIKKNIAPLIEPGVFKVLDKMDGFRVAVSGGRKVAVVLSKSHRKVRVFEMEIDGDDEEDETLDTTTQSQSTNNDQSTSEKPNTSTGATADVTFCNYFRGVLFNICMFTVILAHN